MQITKNAAKADKWDMPSSPITPNNEICQPMAKYHEGNTMTPCYIYVRTQIQKNLIKNIKKKNMWLTIYFCEIYYTTSFKRLSYLVKK